MRFWLSFVILAGILSAGAVTAFGGEDPDPTASKRAALLKELGTLPAEREAALKEIEAKAIEMKAAREKASEPKTGEVIADDATIPIKEPRTVEEVVGGKSVRDLYEASPEDADML